MGREVDSTVVTTLKTILEYLDRHQLSMAAIHIESALQSLEPQDLDLNTEHRLFQ